MIPQNDKAHPSPVFDLSMHAVIATKVCVSSLFSIASQIHMALEAYAAANPDKNPHRCPHQS